jgi:hypothetical protein
MQAETSLCSDGRNVNKGKHSYGACVVTRAGAEGPHPPWSITCRLQVKDARHHRDKHEEGAVRLQSTS